MGTTSIKETFTLPSHGLVYDLPINPTVTLSAMTTLDEMRRTAPTDTPYKVMSDIIESCIEEDLGLHVYQLCTGDYQFLLHKLRIVSYGTEYKMLVTCKECGEATEGVGDLDSLVVREYDPSIIEKKLITLPVTGHMVELRFQTPRDLDLISYKAKEMKKQTRQNLDYSLLFSVISAISKIDGAEMNEVMVEEFVKKLPFRDANFILNKSMELENTIGVESSMCVRCANCDTEMEVPFRFTSEFFRPSNY